MGLARVQVLGFLKPARCQPEALPTPEIVNKGKDLQADCLGTSRCSTEFYSQELFVIRMEQDQIVATSSRGMCAILGSLGEPYHSGSPKKIGCGKRCGKVSCSDLPNNRLNLADPEPVFFESARLPYLDRTRVQ